MKTLKAPFQALLRQNFYIANTYHNLRTQLNDIGSCEKIVIYQMGKVGSTSLYESLKERKPEASVYHVHFLSSNAVENALSLACNKYDRIGAIHTHLTHSQYLRKKLERGLDRENEKWKVITLVRDPIARDVSSFFQNLNLSTEYDYSDKRGSMSQTEIAQELVHIYLDKRSQEKEPFSWLDSELNAVLKLDLYAEPFPKDKGYNIYQRDHFDLLLIKLEQLNQCAQEALKDFLNIDGFELKTSNVASDKNYKAIYQEFLKLLNLPKSHYERIYGSERVRHFYSDDELQKFRQKWA